MSDVACAQPDRVLREKISPGHLFLQWRHRVGDLAPGWLVLLGGLLIFSPLIEGGTTHLAHMTIRFMVLLLLGVYVVRGIRAGALALEPCRVGFPVLTILGLAALSLWTSPYVHQSVQWLIILLTYALLLYLLVCFLESWHHIATLLWLVIGMGVLEAGAATVQAAWLGATRPSGTFFNPNFLAGYLSAVWAIVLGYFCFTCKMWCGSSQRAGTGWILFRRQILPLVALSLLLIGLVVTGSRAGLLTLAVGTAVVLFARYGRLGVAMLAGIVLLAILVPNPLRERISREHDRNPVSYARVDMWSSAVKQMVDRPFGVGLGLYQYTSPLYAFPVEGRIARYSAVAKTPHNEYLQIGVELGVTGLLVFGCGIALLGAEALAALRLRLRRWQRGVLVGGIAASLSMLVHALVDSNFHNPALAILLILCAGVVLSAKRVSGAPRRLPYQVPISRPRVWACMTVLLLLAAGAEVARLGMAWRAHELGSRALTQRDVQQAQAYYERARALDPGKALYHSSMAALFFQVYRQTQSPAHAQVALSELQRARELNPLDGRLSALLGHVYVALAQSRGPTGDGPDRSHPDDVTGQEVGASRHALLRAALSAYQQAGQREPFTVTYKVEQGRILHLLGRDKEAEGLLQETIALEPNFLPARAWLLRRYLSSGRLEAAEAEYAQILERHRRLAGVRRAPHEERFLDADVDALAVELKTGRAMS